MSDLRSHRHAIDLCVYCPKLCRFACPVAEAERRETVIPWALVTRADDVLVGRAPLDAATAEIWGHCTGCRQCQSACKHENDVPTVLFAARAAAREAGVAPSAWAEWANASARPSAGFEGLRPEGPIRVLPGHARPEAIAAILDLLRAAGIGPLGRPAAAIRAAGHRHRAAGDPLAADAALTALRGATAGAERIICVEPEDAVALRGAWPQGPRIDTWIEAVAAAPLALQRVVTGDVLYLDACQLGRGLGLYDPPRALLAQVIGGVVLEATMNRSEGGCCGVGAGFAALAPKAARTVAEDAAADVADVPVVIAAGACAEHLRAALAPRPVHHLAELLHSALPDAQETP